MITSRRGFLIGLGSMLAAPAIVHAGNLMPIRALPREFTISPLYDHPSFVAAREAQFEGYESRFIFRTSIPADAWRRYNESSVTGLADRQGVQQQRDYGDVKFVPMPWAVPR